MQRMWVLYNNFWYFFLVLRIGFAPLSLSSQPFVFFLIFLAGEISRTLSLVSTHFSVLVREDSLFSLPFFSRACVQHPLFFYFFLFVCVLWSLLFLFQIKTSSLKALSLARFLWVAHVVCGRRRPERRWPSGGGDERRRRRVGVGEATVGVRGVVVL